MNRARICGLLLLFVGAMLSAGIPTDDVSVRRTVLDNGLTVITQTDRTSAITVLEIVIKGGAAAEPSGQTGISYLATRLAMEIPDQETGRDFMVKALRTSMVSRDDDAAIHLEFLTEFADSILGAVAAIIADPLITNIRTDRLIEAANHQRRILADDASQEARLAHRDAFFGGTGYAGATFGTEESLAGLKTKDIKEFYRRRFAANNIIVVALSDLAPEELRSLISRHFGKFAPAAGEAEAARTAITAKAPPYPERRLTKDQQQSLISCAFPLPPISRQDDILVSLLENVLGRGPGSRLWALRTEKQLAYVVSCLAFPFREAGFLECYLETDAARTEKSREALAAALREFWDAGISAEEFDAGKAVLWADFLRANETKANRARTLGFFESTGLGADFLLAFEDALASLTLEQANAAIKRLFDPARASWVIVGPEKS
jgi:predicted Zn-dependent peptidase